MRSIAAAAAPDLALLREQFRRQTPGQIVHDSLHGRSGWTESFLLRRNDDTIGYGSVAVDGPWRGTRTVFEFHLASEALDQAEFWFADFLRDGRATHFEIQTEPPLLRKLATPRAQAWTTDRIVFRDAGVTALRPPSGAVFRRVRTGEAVFPHQAEPVGDWVVELAGEVVATGGWLSHYNPPHRDLYLEVAEAHRRRGIGSWLLQELKQACREDGGVACARCHPDNLASRACLARAGFEPWCEIVTSPVKTSPA